MQRSLIIVVIMFFKKLNNNRKLLGLFLKYYAHLGEKIVRWTCRLLVKSCLKSYSVFSKLLQK